MANEALHRNERGAILFFAIFILLFALPIAFVLLKQTMAHRRQAVQSQVRIRDYYLARSASEAVVLQMRTNTGFFAATGDTWIPGAGTPFTVELDSATVSVQVMQESDNW